MEFQKRIFIKSREATIHGDKPHKQEGVRSDKRFCEVLLNHKEELIMDPANL